MFLFDLARNKIIIGLARTILRLQGPETESLEIFSLDGYTLIVVGNEKPGTLSVYSIDESSPVFEPKFEGMFHDIHRLDDTWENLILHGDISMLGPEDIRYYYCCKKQKGSYRELIESNPTSHSQDQKGKERTHKFINVHKNMHSKPNQQLFSQTDCNLDTLIENDRKHLFFTFFFLFLTTNRTKQKA